ncbi:hypothetical protein QN277_003733 [Acacia crassicarpa]|uniref:Uncharacterized protein n=1 Tax=Acacia crassicarpa TaxID=499986 RepID=A0AAE1JWH6_9FABA|nr:hypothetical protein QN277_003733 [Acacia crassicarpa]
MCRSTDLLPPSPYTHDGACPNVKALFVHVRTSASEINDPLPQFLTILFNPPNHSLSLHRLLNHSLPHAIFAAKLSLCPRRRRPSQPLSFQLFLGEAMLLKGALIEQDQNRWTLDSTNWVRLVNHKERVKNCVNFGHLEQIPEEMELPSEDSHEVMDLEGLRRTVDLGIWVLCLGLGVGYLVSRASVRKFRPYLNF